MGSAIVTSSGNVIEACAMVFGAVRLIMHVAKVRAIDGHGLWRLPRHTRLKQGWHVNSLVPVDMHIGDSVNSVVDWERPRRRRWWLHSFV